MYTFDKDLESRVMGIYFRMTYFGCGENSEEDKAFIQNNKFKVIVTEDSIKNGWPSDKEKFKTYPVKFLYPYNLKHMNVDRYSSTLELEEFPGVNFNTVNFKFLKL